MPEHLGEATAQECNKSTLTATLQEYKKLLPVDVVAQIRLCLAPY